MTAIQPVLAQAQKPQEWFPVSRFFLLVAPIIYLAYALITPPFQTFDENQHLYRAWQVSDLKLTGERRGAHSGGELPPGLATATLNEIGSLVPQGRRHIVVRPFSQIFSWNTPIGQDRAPIYYNFSGAILYSPVSYVPQSLAVRMGEAAGLSVEWTLRLGRILNGAVCIGLIWWALTILPYGRLVMATVALLPPTAAAAASFGQDGLVIGAGFLLTSVGLKAAIDRRWSRNAATIFGVAGVAVAMTKIVYLPLVALAAIPKPRGLSWKRWITVPVVTGLVAALLLFAWMRTNAHALVPGRASLPPMSEQISWIIGQPFEFMALIVRTYAVRLESIWGHFYVFGDSTVPAIYAAALAGTAAILTSMVYGEPPGTDLNKSRRAWILIVCLSVAVLIATALFLGATPRGATYVHGIQGRYFLPVIPLMAIALIRRGEQGPPLLIVSTIALAFLANVVTLATILRTFYTFDGA